MKYVSKSKQVCNEMQMKVIFNQKKRRILRYILKYIALSVDITSRIHIKRATGCVVGKAACQQYHQRRQVLWHREGGEGNVIQEHIKLLNPSASIQNVLDTVGFKSFFAIFLDISEAIASFG